MPYLKTFSDNLTRVEQELSDFLDTLVADQEPEEAIARLKEVLMDYFVFNGLLADDEINEIVATTEFNLLGQQPPDGLLTPWNLYIESSTIVAKKRKLKATWSYEKRSSVNL